jgi:hypothetical protein
MHRGSAAFVALLAAAALMPVPGSAGRSRCDVGTPAGLAVDCFSGAYHGTGFMPMEETISFRSVSAMELHTSALWRQWLADSAKRHDRRPCSNANAVAYVGTFSFYNGGSFVACSRSTPNTLNGYFRVGRAYTVTNEGPPVTLTRGAFSASASRDNVLELVFSDPSHRHYAQPEVVLGKFRN